MTETEKNKTQERRNNNFLIQKKILEMDLAMSASVN